MASDRVSAIVLAGGRSKRFGADKLAVEIGGRTLLEHAVAAVAELAHEVIVVEAADGVERCRTGMPEHRVVRDTTPGAGPLAGMRDGAAAATGVRLLVVAGDMPTLRPEVLRLLLAALERDEEIEAAILSPAPAHPSVQPLPMGLRRVPALDAATRLLAADRRSLRGLLDALRTTPIPAATWLAIDPEAATLRDIDTPADLGALRGRRPG